MINNITESLRSFSIPSTYFIVLINLCRLYLLIFEEKIEIYETQISIVFREFRFQAQFVTLSLKDNYGLTHHLLKIQEKILVKIELQPQVSLVKTQASKWMNSPESRLWLLILDSNYLDREFQFKVTNYLLASSKLTIVIKLARPLTA